MPSMEALRKANIKYYNDNAILTISAMGYPIYVDASRGIMDNNHHLQRVILDHTQFPYVFGNCENMFGHASTYNVLAKNDLLIYRIIPKFRHLDIPRSMQPELVIFYDQMKKEYDLIYKQDVEDLPEKYGFQYDHSKLDSLNEGDILEHGTVMTRPTSYDEFDNYGFGQNVNMMYRLNMWNLEDAIEVSTRLAARYTSTNVYLVKVALNDNNILCKIYDGIKCFPDIGEAIQLNTLCSKKTLVGAQELFDLKSSNMKKSLPSDIPFLLNGTVVDLDVYCNKRREDIPHKQHNEQVLQYIDADIDFHTRVWETTQELIDSGAKVSSAIREWNTRCFKLLNKDEEDGYIIKDDANSPFSNIVMYFLVKEKVGLTRGQKLCGRYGNKGVVSRVTPTREMPHMETGEVIDVCFDSLGVPGRLTIMALIEKTVTAQARQIRDHLRTIEQLEKKEQIFFQFLSIYNEEHATRVRDDYNDENQTKEAKLRYFREYIETYGIFVHMEPFWQKKSAWKAINEVYDTFDFLHPYRIYFWQKDTKRWVKQIKPDYTGYMYIMKLKQTAEQGLSVRATGPVNNYGLPDKSNAAKNFTVQHSDTAVRMGRQEFENNLMYMDPYTIVKEYLFQRNSPIGSMELGTQLYDHYEGVYDIEPTPKMRNKNVDILDARLLQMGYEMRCEYDLLDLSEEPGIKTHIYNNQKYICPTDEMCKIIAKDVARLRYENMDFGDVYIGREMDYDTFLDEIADEIKRQITLYLR